MTERKINRGSEIRAKGKSMGRERSAHLPIRPTDPRRKPAA